MTPPEKSKNEEELKKAVEAAAQKAEEASKRADEALGKLLELEVEPERDDNGHNQPALPPVKPAFSISEQEMGDLHILRRSIIPFLFRVALTSAIGVALNIFFVEVTIGLRGILSPAGLVFAEIFFSTFIVLAVLGFLTFLTLRWVNDLYIIKFPDITIRTGLFMVKEKDVVANKVRNIEIEQSIFGRWFDYGTIVLKRAVGLEDIRLYDIPAPHHLIDVFKKE